MYEHKNKVKEKQKGVWSNSNPMMAVQVLRGRRGTMGEKSNKNYQ